MIREERKEKIELILRDLPEAARLGIIHPNYRHYDPLLPQELCNAIDSAHAYGEGAKIFKKSFPNLTSEIIWMMADDGMSATRWLSRGTFTGEPFFGTPPNGKKIEFQGITMYRWENDQVVEGISLYDNVNFAKQMAGE